MPLVPSTLDLWSGIVDCILITRPSNFDLFFLLNMIPTKILIIIFHFLQLGSGLVPFFWSHCGKSEHENLFKYRMWNNMRKIIVSILSLWPREFCQISFQTQWICSNPFNWTSQRKQYPCVQAGKILGVKAGGIRKSSTNPSWRTLHCFFLFSFHG